VNILIVEDEPVLREGLTDLLDGAGHLVQAVGDGPSGLQRGLNPEVDLIVLDLMLPGMDGIEVCRKVRERRPDVYILMLTARADEEDKVRGLGRGADDYVTKPFGARELLARIEAVARRLRTDSGPETIEADGCRLDFGRCLVQRDEATHPLTAREVGILRHLYRNRERAVSRAELLEAVWKAPGDLETRTVDMTISNLRHKIERNPTQPAIVVTVKGVGYAWGNRD